MVLSPENIVALMLAAWAGIVGVWVRSLLAKLNSMELIVADMDRRLTRLQALLEAQHVVAVAE